jgi:hypothetical protein
MCLVGVCLRTRWEVRRTEGDLFFVKESFRGLEGRGGYGWGLLYLGSFEMIFLSLVLEFKREGDLG